jgi:hypothetical protein
VFVQQAVATGGQKRLGQSVHGKTPKQRVVKKPMAKWPSGVMTDIKQDACQKCYCLTSTTFLACALLERDETL